MESGYETKLSLINEQHKKDIQRLEGLSEKKDIKAYIDELNQRVKLLEEEFDAKQQTVTKQQSLLATQVAKDDKELTEKKLQYTRDLLDLADRKLNPEYYAAKEGKERTSSFVTAKTESMRPGSLRESMLSRTRTSSIGEAPFKTARSGSVGVAGVQQAPVFIPVKYSDGSTTGTLKALGSSSIDSDIQEIERLFKQAAGQGYKNQNAEEISKHLTTLAATLFLQIRETDVINPKRHKAKDSTDLRYSQFSNRLYEIANEPFKRLDDELKKIDAESKSPEERQKIMQEKEKLIKMLLKISEDLREKRNFIALMGVAAVLDAQINKKANVEVKEKLSESDLDKIKANMKLYEPGSSELTTIQEKYLREKKSVIPQIGSIKNKFVYIDEYKENEKTRQSAEDQEEVQIALFRAFQVNLARERKENLPEIKLKYSEIELQEVDQQAKDLQKNILSAPNVEERQKLYEQLMVNLTKQIALVEEQQELMKNIIKGNPAVSKRPKDITLAEANKLRDLDLKRKSLIGEMSDSKNAMLFNESKLIATMKLEQVIEKYSGSFSKQLSKLNGLLAQLSDESIALPKKAEILKDADIIMHELDIKAKAINHRGKDLSTTDEKAKAMMKDIEKIFAKKVEFDQAKNNIEKSLGRSDSISLHSTIRPSK